LYNPSEKWLRRLFVLYTGISGKCQIVASVILSRRIARSDGNYHVVTNGKAGNDVYCEYNGVTADKNI
ncbi:hypothetical protein RCU41_04230, partial [Escherichia marmotae]|nr:hypothetical protein [Escherichia marmotae]MED0018938.1 hypothetical protein [Escherichia marmotae]